MKISIITLYPEMFLPVINASIVGRAQTKGLCKIELINLRNFGEGTHKNVDDRPYGGGPGMVLRADILAKAYLATKEPGKQEKTYTILTSPSGVPFKQDKARNLLNYTHIIIVCGHFEGVDQRFIDMFVDEEISIGDYVLTGGEVPAMVIVDAATRLIPGVLGKEESLKEESFNQNLLEAPQYTHPEIFNKIAVPEVLLSGNHEKVVQWKKEQSEDKTRKVRPDLLLKRI